MKSYSTPRGKRLIAELRVLRDIVFEDRCKQILQTVYPTLTSSPARSAWDRAGIDLCLFADARDEMLLGFQCKGFEVPDFGPSQLNQCLHSIEAFKNASFKTQKFYLIVNRIVRGAPREQLQAALSDLVNSKCAELAELLDLEAFLELVFQEAQTQLSQLLASSVSAFQEQHRLRMEEDDYHENVPFQISGSADLQNNPLRLVEERILSLVAEPNNKRSWMFISGEFGFGKTSLALHLSETLQKHGIITIYLPAAQFHAQALEMEHLFMWEALRVVLQDEVERDSERHQIFHSQLKEIFKREKRIVLVFDGIDEHPICWRENGLLNVFGIFKMFNATCLFTVREEFLAERSGHFHAAIKGCPGAVMLQLREWPDALILEFTQTWRKTFAKDESFLHLAHFEDAIRSGRYVEFYGDIPKRPLFLKMLLDDVAKGDLQTRNLAEIYSIYIAKKFAGDRATSTSRPVVLRPLSLSEDYEYVCGKLFEVMTLAAGRMYSIEEGAVRIRPRLAEHDLRECAKLVSGDALDIPSILLNSVMVPVGRRNRNARNGHLEVAFAHTSFQEFFLAHHVLAVLQERIQDPVINSGILPKPVIRFLRGLIASLSPEEKTIITSRCAAIGENTSLS
jgi:hypothetical protein